jgi:hypothetical protein
VYNPRKFWLVLVAAVLALVVIACSCSTFTPTPTAAPRVPTSPPPPTVPVNTMPSLEGYWLDTDTEVVHTIEWQYDRYVVTSAIDAEEGSYPITDQSWSNDTLTWTYYRASTDVYLTYVTVSVSADVLHTTWSNSDGNSGTWDLERVDSP